MKYAAFKNLFLMISILTLFQTHAQGAKNVKVVLAVPKRSGINMITRTTLAALSSLLVRPVLKKILPLAISKAIVSESSMGKFRAVDCLTGLAASLLVAAAEYLYYRYYPVTEDDWDLLLLNNPQNLYLQPSLVENSVLEQDALEIIPPLLDEIAQEPSIELSNLLLNVDTNTVSLMHK